MLDGSERTDPSAGIARTPPHSPSPGGPGRKRELPAIATAMTTMADAPSHAPHQHPRRTPTGSPTSSEFPFGANPQHFPARSLRSARDHPGVLRESARDTNMAHAVGADVVMRLLMVREKEGLSSTYATEVLQRIGPNRLAEKQRERFFHKVWRQVRSVLILILVIAAIVAGALQEWAEFGLIIGVVIINTMIGLIQEGKAERATAALKAMLSPKATVMRDGSIVTVDAESLVPGDLCHLKLGDLVPADLRLVAVSGLEIQEAMLTGESKPVRKVPTKVSANAPLALRKNMAYSGTLVQEGTGHGVVVATGDATELGKINQLVGEVAEKPTNLQLQLDQFGRWIGLIIFPLVVASFLLQYFTGSHAGDARESFIVAVAIAVAVVPEGLPAILSITLALGQSFMASKKAIVKTLPAVETLGSVAVVCSDKTGTLTKNEMTVVAVQTSRRAVAVEGVGYSPKGGRVIDRVDALGRPVSSNTVAGRGDDSPPDARLAALARDLVMCTDESALSLASDGQTVLSVGNPTEAALVCLAAKLGVVDAKAARAGRPRFAAIPFNSEHKFMATYHLSSTDPEAKLEMYVKGAPDRVIERCVTQWSDDIADPAAVGTATQPLDAPRWTKAVTDLSSQGLRCIAFARATIDRSSASKEELSNKAYLTSSKPFLTLCAVFAIMDPPRPECIEAIKCAHRAGIVVKMITGDSPNTALAIARMLGIADRDHPDVLTGPEIDNMMTTIVNTSSSRGTSRSPRPHTQPLPSPPPQSSSSELHPRRERSTEPVAKTMRPTSDGAVRKPELEALILSTNVFARASPTNKIEIVRALQARNQICSMTGDGVNDAPALRAADIGVAMGVTGTPVAREAAKIVLQDDHFATIIVAVKEGRRVYDNLRKILIFNQPANFAQGGVVFFALAFQFQDVPLTAIQILYVNLVTSVTLGLFLAVEPAEVDVMDRPPRRPGKRLIGRLFLWRCVWVSVVMIAFVLGSFYWVGVMQGAYPPAGSTLPPDFANVTYPAILGRQRAQAMNTLVFAEVAYSLNCRFLVESSAHPRVLRGNRTAWFCVVLMGALQCFTLYVPGVNAFFSQGPIGGDQWGITILFAVCLFGLVELEKALIVPVWRPYIQPWLFPSSPDVQEPKPVRPFEATALQGASLRGVPLDEGEERSGAADDSV